MKRAAVTVSSWAGTCRGTRARLRDTLLAGRDFGMLVCYLREEGRVFETYWTTARGNEGMGNSLLMLDMTVYGRQEPWEDSPESWPQRYGRGQPMSHQFRLDGRPIAQWSRLAAGRSDDLGRTAADSEHHGDLTIDRLTR